MILLIIIVFISNPAYWNCIFYSNSVKFTAWVSYLYRELLIVFFYSILLIMLIIVTSDILHIEVYWPILCI